MAKIRYSHVRSFVLVPEKVAVLLRDVQAGDSHLDETIDLVEELHRDLGHWIEDLHAERDAVREAKAREARREARRAERLARRAA